MPPQRLQKLIALGRPDLVRHIVAATFRETILRPDPFFFVSIWPYEKKWSMREDQLGEKLCEFFAATQQLYLVAGGMSPILAALVGEDDETKVPHEGPKGMSHTSASAILIGRLGTTGNAMGHFYRLRQIALQRYFRPLIPSIEERNVKHAHPELRRLEALFESGEMEREILNEFFGVRELRGDHKANLRRYIQSELTAIRSWLSEQRDIPSAEGSSYRDQLIQEVRSLASQIATTTDDAVDANRVVGSKRWLESHIGTTIRELWSGGRSERPFARFGEIPSADSLFQQKQSASLSIAWPTFFENAAIHLLLGWLSEGSRDVEGRAPRRHWPTHTDREDDTPEGSRDVAEVR